MDKNYNLINGDCLTELKKIPDDSIDCVFTDPPFGIAEDTFDKHYNRDDQFVINDYHPAPSNYGDWSKQWVSECERVLKPSGALFIVSGWTKLKDILNAVELPVVNHIIWQYSFGVHTKKKFVSAHYHIIYSVKPPINQRTFNQFARFNETKESYADRQDVWFIRKEYKRQQEKTQNSLPVDLVKKAIQYTTHPGDTVLDPFAGSGTTLVAAQQLGRQSIGIEISEKYCDLVRTRLNETDEQ